MNSATRATRAQSCLRNRLVSSILLMFLVSTGEANETEFKFGGYVKVDAIYDLDHDLGPTLNANNTLGIFSGFPVYSDFSSRSRCCS